MIISTLGKNEGLRVIHIIFNKMNIFHPSKHILLTLLETLVSTYFLNAASDEKK